MSISKLKEDLASKNIGLNTDTFNGIEERVVDSYESFLYYLQTSINTSSVIDRFRSHPTPFYPVGIQGLSDIDKAEDIGSHRKTIHDTNFAKYLTKLLLPRLPTVIKLSSTSPMDWQSDNPEKLSVWELESVSPVFRYMEYGEGGQHNPHYDSEYKDPEDPLRRTLFSGVLYLTTNDVYTRVIDDYQEKIEFSKRNLSDWSLTLKETDNNVIRVFPSQVGNIAIFPHRVCHDVSLNTTNDVRIIIRFDIFCKAVK